MPAESFPAPPRRRTRRWVVVVAAVVAALLIVVGGVWLTRRGTPGAAVADRPVAVQTATVVTTDMSATTSLTGTLGYGRAQPVKGARDGIVTWLPRPGATVGRGDQLYRVDDEPVPLFYGGLPLYRDLAVRGTVGRDVRVVAANLTALGYPVGRQPGPGERVARTTPAPPAPPGARPTSGPTPSPTPTRVTSWVTVRSGDGVLTRSLIAALRRWQRDNRLPVTGRIGVGDVVVLSGAVRVESLTAQQGDAAAAPLMTVTPTAKVITVAAEAAEAAAIGRGDPVTVHLPDDKTVPGEVTAVGATVEEGGQDGGSDPPKRSVTVAVSGNRGLHGIDAANVEVDFVGETHRDVLAVPVGALVALSEGGYAVQLAEGGRLVAVETGMFAKGMVEVAGAGLVAGTDVVTTS